MKAEKTNKATAKAAGKEHAKEAQAKSNGKEEKQEKNNTSKIFQYLAVVLIILVIVYLIYFVFANVVSTKFSTFSSNFNAAPRIAIAVTFSNMTQYVEEESCFTKMINTIAHTRNASTIDFFLLNQTNCTYSSTGLGKPVSIAVVSASRCISVAKSEPSLFLNYSSQNSTVITPYHLYISGNGAYMASCPIDAELT